MIFDANDQPACSINGAWTTSFTGVVSAIFILSFPRASLGIVPHVLSPYIHLVSDLPFEPLVFFIFLWLTDLVTLVFLVLRCIRHFSRHFNSNIQLTFYSIGPNRSEENSLVADMPKLSPNQTILAAGLPILTQ